MKFVRWLVYILAFAVLVLHQDWWNFHNPSASDLHPDLIFGFLPIGLAYHAAYSIACSVLMALLVAVAWPKELESLETIQRPGGDTEGGH
jgi:hypothetical protein